nr:IclR family transcriptional regulator [Qaidamihabitans albus]
MAVREATEVIYVARADGSRSVRMVSAVGRRLPAHCTAVGKLLLAPLPDTEIDALYPPGVALARMTGRGPDRPEALWQELVRVRETGLAHEHGESNLDVVCVAAPVRDGTGAVVAALSVSVPAHRWGATPRPRWERWARDGADALSTALGLRG